MHMKDPDVDPDQSRQLLPSGAVWSRSTLFAQTWLSEFLGSLWHSDFDKVLWHFSFYLVWVWAFFEYGYFIHLVHGYIIYFSCTVKLLKINSDTQRIAVIILKVEQCGFTIE